MGLHTIACMAAGWIIGEGLSHYKEPMGLINILVGFGFVIAIIVMK
jgi:hypothetical protein